MNAKSTATDRLERLLALVPWVAGQPEGVPIDAVCERFEVSATELIRDLDTVMMVGVYPFTPDTMIEAWVEDDRVMIHYADAFARPLRLTAEEAVRLIAAAAGVAAVPGADTEGPLQRATAKLTSVVGSADVEVDLGDASSEVFTLVDTARRERRQVEIDYPDASDDQPHRRRIEPSQVFSTDGRWYVSGWCHQAEDNRIFRMDRILAAHRTEAGFTHDDRDAPGTVDFDESFPQVVLEVDLSVAWLFDSVPVMSRVDTDTSARIRLAIGSPRWLARLLVQLGSRAEVVESDPSLDPGELARREAERILTRYR